MSVKRFSVSSVIITVITLAIGLVWIFPMYWALNTSLTVDTKTVQIPPSWFPSPLVFDAYTYVIKNTMIVRWYLNTIVDSVAITAVVLVLSLMCAYAMSQIRFRGRRLLFVAILAGFMIPWATNVVPLFMFMNKLRLVNSYWGVILPQLAAPPAIVAVVTYKRFFDQMPLELADAAHMDGAGEMRILFRLFLPLNHGISWALAILTFIYAWNNFFWPFIVVNSNDMMTIPIGITQVQSWYGIAYSRQMASAVLAALPTVVLYLIFQRRVAEGVAITSGIR
ncbi:MAG TPA: carbohydrate ABC transporter permease [Spirochaetia bacterium]|nr:carbohydrate ABC transporter permease [Spirochaetia bacterium]